MDELGVLRCSKLTASVIRVCRSAFYALEPHYQSELSLRIRHRTIRTNRGFFGSDPARIRIPEFWACNPTVFNPIRANPIREEPYKLETRNLFSVHQGGFGNWYTKESLSEGLN